MNRLEEVRKIIDQILMKQENLEERRCGFVHLYGVAQFCGLLAMKRGLQVELCQLAGMLHDISSYKTGDSQNHAYLSSLEAKTILISMDCFNADEVNLICSSIRNHSDKHLIGSDYDELLKDADVLQHYLYNPDFIVRESNQKRLTSILSELNLI